jgi:hypothetical protein
MHHPIVYNTGHVIAYMLGSVLLGCILKRNSQKPEHAGLNTITNKECI